ncbi:hypothetical protein GCM10009123_15080 [Kangiella japonica]|uniref:DUF3261 domain-containing protein n=1 Tax=Kangiella japonica TaxID=647384 RepID=A0ABN0T0Q1_9GAMM
MRFLKVIPLLLLSSLLLGACTSHYQGQNERVLIADNVEFELVSTIPFKNGLTLTQSATVTYNTETHDLIFHTEIRNRTLTMVGLTPTGTRLFTIVTKEGEIRAEGFSSIIESIKPQFLLADMQLSLWPMEQLQANISGAKYLEINALTRQMTTHNKALISIHYSEPDFLQGQIEFTHHQRGYTLSLTPIAVEYSTND